MLPSIYADEGRLFNAFYNLVNNAIPETPAGGSVTVNGRFDHESDHVMLVVQDTGQGMDAGSCDLADPRHTKVTLELPRIPIRIQRFAGPVKGIGPNLGKSPARRRPIWTSSYLHDILAAPATDLFFPMLSSRINPGDAPSLNRGIPDS